MKNTNIDQYIFLVGTKNLIKAFLLAAIIAMPFLIISHQLKPIAENETNSIILADLLIHFLFFIISSKFLKISFADLWKFEIKTPNIIEALALYAFTAILILPFLERINLPEWIGQDGLLQPALEGHIPMIINVCLLGPVMEELIYRGLYMQYFMQKTTPVNSILYSAILFGLVHVSPNLLPYTFAMGILFGYLYYRTKSLFTPIIIHILHNSLVLIGHTTT